jgi:hypothetical protein
MQLINNNLVIGIDFLSYPVFQYPTYMNNANTLQIKRSIHSFFLAVLMIATALSTQAQNLVSNSNFSGGSSSGWTTGCSVEVNPQSTYGGPSGSIYVTEIDVERCLSQQVCILPGLSYTLAYTATRRPQSGSPANPGLQVKVTGNVSNTNYVNNIKAYTNTTWNLQTQSFTITVPAGSADTKLNIQFLPNNNSTTYGVILSDIELAPTSASALSIGGPTTSAVAVSNSYYLTGSPSGASYNWSFSNGANFATSASATPSNITWSTMGTKTVSVAISNSVCTMASYSQTVNVSAILAVQLSDFTGESKDNDGLLSWAMANGAGTEYFVIERSADGNIFDSIGMIAWINNAAAYTYHFTDKSMLNGNNFYRLRTVNRDGATSYSGVVILTNNFTLTTGKMNIFPNPATALLNFEIASATGGEVTVQVFNLSGILMIKKQLQLSAGNNLQSLPTSMLRTGNYFLQVSNAQGTVRYMQAFARI